MISANFQKCDICGKPRGQKVVIDSQEHLEQVKWRSLIGFYIDKDVDRRDIIPIQLFTVCQDCRNQPINKLYALLVDTKTKEAKATLDKIQQELKEV